MTFKALIANARQLERDAAAYRKELERLRGRLDNAEQLIAAVTRDIDLLDVTDAPTASRKPKLKGKKRQLVVKMLEASRSPIAIAKEAGIDKEELFHWMFHDPEIKAAHRAGLPSIAEVKALIVKRLEAGAAWDEVFREAKVSPELLWRWTRDPEIRAAYGSRRP